MQRFNKSEAVHNVTRIAMARQDVVVGHSMKPSKLRTGLASLGASCRAMSSGALSKSAEAQVQAMRRLASRMMAWLAGPHAPRAYAYHAYARVASGGSRGLSSAGFERIPRWATAPDID